MDPGFGHTVRVSREQIAQVSKPVLEQLHALPRWVVPLGTLALVAIGALAPLGLAVPALLVVFVFVAWIAYLSWPAVSSGGRLLRVIMLGLVAAVGVSRFLA